MQRILTVTLFVLFFSSHILAQQLPLYTQYVFDPYLINPSMVGYANRTEINALYRKQWTQIADGPKTLQFDAQLPVNDRVAVGLNVFNDKSVLLSATSVLLTFGYKVPLAVNHTLGFGISAGIVSNKLDLSEVAPPDANDPALLTATLNNMAMNGQFGVNYSFKKFILGFSMVNLFERKVLTPEQFQKVKFGGLGNQIFFTSYRFTISEGNWYFQPNVAYRLAQDKTNYYEASGFVNYRNRVDLGGGYRQYFGPSAMLRLTLGQLQVGFAYDFPSNRAQVSTGGTQEIQVKWRFGKSDDAALVKKSSTPPPKEEQKPQEEKKPTEQKKEDVVEQPKVEPPIVTAPVEVSAKVEPKQEAADTVSAPIHEEMYFIIGTFESRANAQKFLNQILRKGVKAEIKESKVGSEPHYFHVHMPQYKSREVSLEKILELQKTTGFSDAWFKKLD